MPAKLQWGDACSCCVGGPCTCCAYIATGWPYIGIYTEWDVTINEPRLGGACLAGFCDEFIDVTHRLVYVGNCQWYSVIDDRLRIVNGGIIGETLNDWWLQFWDCSGPGWNRAGSILGDIDTGSAGPMVSVCRRITRTVTDGVTTNGSDVVTSATAIFHGADSSNEISGAGIPPGSFILLWLSPTSVQISNPATATATGVTLTITPWFGDDTPQRSYNDPFFETACGSPIAGAPAAVGTITYEPVPGTWIPCSEA